MQEPVDNKVTLLGGSRKRWYLFIMHQSIPTVPSQQRPPPSLLGYCGAFAHLVSPGGGAFVNFALPGGRAFANPGAIPELLTRMWFFIRI